MGQRLQSAHLWLAARLFHLVCFKAPPPIDGLEQQLEAGLASTERFFSRYPPELSVAGKSVLDYGCGGAATCVWAARHGARRVLGVDIGNLDQVRELLSTRPGQIADVIELRQIASPAEIGDERFDVVISKNTFEHVSDPAEYVAGMRDHLAPDGRVLIGFSPLWKSPLGGHIDFMTRLPWAHLLFPEEVIMNERRRFRPEEDARAFSDILGGLNKMTLERFEQVMTHSGLQAEYFKLNAGVAARGAHRRALLSVLRVLARLPFLREYFAFSVHTIWRRRPAAAPAVAPAGRSPQTRYHAH